MLGRPSAGPSRPSTPTPTALDAAPLRLPPSPRLVSLADDAAHSAAASSSSLVPPSPVPRSPTQSTLRSRRAASPLPPAALGGDPSDRAVGSSSTSRPSSPGPSSRIRVDPDVTRPSLRRLTNDALGIAALGRAGGTPSPGGGTPANGDDDGYVLRRDSKGKGKAREYGDAGVRRGASENGAAGKEREVIVHKVQKTDSYASISLQYGITPQALRASNRLWPSDPIYLRSTLLIPLDQCNLPSSSFGVERIAREENGDLTVWERAGANGEKEGLGGAAAREEREGVLLSPRARRLAAASAFELGAQTPHALEPPIDLLVDEENEFHSVWSDGGTPSARTSLDVAQPPLSPEAYLPRTSTSYFAAGAQVLPTAEELVSRTVSPSTATASSSFSPAPSASSRATSPPPVHPSSPAPNGTGGLPSPPLAKRTLRVARLPASSLAFFPPSSSTPSSPRKPTAKPRPEDESLFFGPLTNSLSASFSSLGLDKYLPASLTPSSSSSGRIALPPSPAPGGPPQRSKSRWALLDFGVEEDEAAAGGRPSPGGGAVRREDYFALAGGAAGSARRKSPAGGGAGGVGLEDAGSWASRRPPLPGAGGGASPRQGGHRKAKDSNERVETLGGMGAGRTDVRDAFGLR
ncbi:hypothetical protein JCM10450v2_004603 [Rhodotorula kratochvilovae]